MKSHSDKLDQPPFPPLSWNDCCWEGDLDLTHLEPAGLTINLVDHTQSRIPSRAQEKALVFLIENEERVIAAVLSALKPYYSSMRPRYQDFLGADFERLMPPVETSEDLRPLIDLHQIHIHTESKNGLAYLGLQFGCTWDEEHGAGVLMHGDRVVEIADADVSFGWIPEEGDSSAE